MNILAKIKQLFAPAQKTQERSYHELAATSGDDWRVSGISEDAELWQNAWALTSRVRDLFRCNPLYQAYRETLWANVFGANGIMLRMDATEQEDRVIHTPEKAWLEGIHRREDEVQEFFARDQGREFVAIKRMRILGKSAQVLIGEPDVYANTLIERRWLEWQRAEFCDVRGTRNYKTIRQLRLISAVRDGDFFLHGIEDARVNKFGFALRLVNAEWCDRFYNETLPNGNIVVMGIEYEASPWGIGKPVNYHFIKRQPKDWQRNFFGGGYHGRGMHDAIPAEQIIHYARAVDADATRPAPWVASTIPSSRQRDQAMLAEVIAWREAACKTGHYYSDVNPEGGMEMSELVKQCGLPSKLNGNALRPGEWRGLPYGVKPMPNNPLHPNANVKDFRMASIQDGCAGMPGANYSTMANDYAAINFSAGRLQRLDTNETNMLLQQFDIDYAENKIFEKWLKMALTTGAIPLPVTKFEKFNNKIFTGRRWRGVDEVKEATAAGIRISNKLSSYTSENSDLSNDFETIIKDQAKDIMLMKIYGVAPGTTADKGGGLVESEDNTDAAATGDIQAAALNGAQIAALLEIVGKVTSGEIDADAAEALISASFPLMTDEEITGIVSQLDVTKKPNSESVIVEDNAGGTNGKHAIDLDGRLAIAP